MRHPTAILYAQTLVRVSLSFTMATLSDSTFIASDASSSSPQSLLEISNLSIDITNGQSTTRIVDRISLTIPKGKTVALLGESGSGKSLTAMSILRLLPHPIIRITTGSIRFASEPGAQATGLESNHPSPLTKGGQNRACEGAALKYDYPHDSQPNTGVARSSLSLAVANDLHMDGMAKRSAAMSGDKSSSCNLDASIELTTLPEPRLRHIRGRRIAMIFQEPMTALNPVYSVGQQIVDVLQAHNRMSNRDAWFTAVDWLKQVGLPAPERRAREFPHQLSGGMRQRVLIAMALCCYPKLLIADEPTTALDATVQMQILDLLRDLQRRHGMSILFITHDLGVVAEMADYAYVMYAGRIVESAPTRDLLTRPLHPYTQGLLRCVPQLTTQAARTAPDFPDNARHQVPTVGTQCANLIHSEPRASARADAPSEPEAPATGWEPHQPSPLTKGGQQGGLSADDGAPAGTVGPVPNRSLKDQNRARKEAANQSQSGCSSPLTKGGPEGGLPSDDVTSIGTVGPVPNPSRNTHAQSRDRKGAVPLPTIPGTVPEPSRYPTGCRFHTRCQLTFDRAQVSNRDSIPLENAAYPRALRRCTEQQPPLESPSPLWGEGRGEGLSPVRESLLAPIPLASLSPLAKGGSEGGPQAREPLLREFAPNHFVACWEAMLVP